MGKQDVQFARNCARKRGMYGVDFERSVAGFVKAVGGVVMRGEYLDMMSEVLQSKRCIDDEPLSAA